jgi:hypothetical protein
MNTDHYQKLQQRRYRAPIFIFGLMTMMPPVSNAPSVFCKARLFVDILTPVPGNCAFESLSKRKANLNKDWSQYGHDRVWSQNHYQGNIAEYRRYGGV